MLKEDHPQGVAQCHSQQDEDEPYHCCHEECREIALQVGCRQRQVGGALLLGLQRTEYLTENKPQCQEHTDSSDGATYRRSYF